MCVYLDAAVEAIRPEEKGPTAGHQQRSVLKEAVDDVNDELELVDRLPPLQQCLELLIHHDGLYITMGRELTCTCASSLLMATVDEATCRRAWLR